MYLQLEERLALPHLFETGVRRREPKRTDIKLGLTSREKDVFQQMANGLSSKQIAHKLSISIDTVESHRKSLYKKNKREQCY